MNTFLLSQSVNLNKKRVTKNFIDNKLLVRQKISFLRWRK